MILFISKMKLENNGWPILVAWGGWIIIFIILIEIGEFILGMGFSDPFDEEVDDNRSVVCLYLLCLFVYLFLTINILFFKLEIFKIVLLLFHLLVSFGLTLGLVIMI